MLRTDNKCVFALLVLTILRPRKQSPSAFSHPYIGVSSSSPRHRPDRHRSVSSSPPLTAPLRSTSNTTGLTHLPHLSASHPIPFRPARSVPTVLVGDVLDSTSTPPSSITRPPTLGTRPCPKDNRGAARTGAAWATPCEKVGGRGASSSLMGRARERCLAQRRRINSHQVSGLGLYHNNLLRVHAESWDSFLFGQKPFSGT